MFPSIAKSYQVTRDIDANDGPGASNNFAHLFTKKTRTTSDIKDSFTRRQVEVPNCLEPLRNNILGTVCFFEMPSSFICEC